MRNFPFTNLRDFFLLFVSCSPRKVVCFGNVLLDRVIKLEDPELLKRYELELGSKGEMDLEKLNAIITDAANG